MFARPIIISVAVIFLLVPFSAVAQAPADSKQIMLYGGGSLLLSAFVFNKVGEEDCQSDQDSWSCKATIDSVLHQTTLLVGIYLVGYGLIHTLQEGSGTASAPPGDSSMVALIPTIDTDLRGGGLLLDVRF